MNPLLFIAALSLISLLIPACSKTHDTSESEPVPDQHRILERAGQTYTGDLDSIMKRRVIRVLISYSKTNFFFDKGKMRGYEVELLQAYDKFLNRGRKKADKKIRMIFIPMPFSDLLPALVAGKGDIAAAGLTVTRERERVVSFSDPYLPDVNEILVQHASIEGIDTLEDLSGRRLYVLSDSSYVSHLKRLNKTLRSRGLRPVRIVESGTYLETEDILEMVNAGIIDFTVSDDHLASLWSQVLPDITVREDLPIHRGGRIAWAVRKGNPRLRANLNAFVKDIRKGSRLGNILLNRYFAKTNWIDNPNAEAARNKLKELRPLFEKYGNQYDIDWIALAAQAYQESGLNQNKRSPRGAIGIMQLLPSTAAGRNVGIRNIHKTENNIHAGAKYLHFLRERYFSDAEIHPDARLNFAWAAYNAGPRNVQDFRTLAKEHGLDPNQWFHNVEQVAARIIGRETVNYVANINKYYIAYRLYFDSQQERAKERKKMKKNME